jgi:putative zinc finger/helix-turn-helix YgiT family protein
MCENPNELKMEILSSYKYKEGGLPNVILKGIRRHSCDVCGEEYLDFGDIEQLHSLLASVLIQKSNILTGKEIRFLRKYLGYSSSFFSKLVGYESEHLSRIENEKHCVQEVFDRLVRYMVKEKLPNRNYYLQELILNGKMIPNEWLEFSLNTEWESAIA